MSSSLNNNREALRNIVRDFCTQERPEGKTPFKVHGPFDKQTVLKSDVVDRPGCYAIYDAAGMLRYIGMTEEGVGNRARSHFAAAVQSSEFWKDRPADTIDLIEVEHSWEAPSLEAYLTLKTESMRAGKTLP